MQVQLGRRLLVNLVQEVQELLVPVLCAHARHDLAVGDVARSEQRGRAVAHVVVGDAFDIAQPHRQHRLRALERLDLFSSTHSTIADSGGLRYYGSKNAPMGEWARPNSLKHASRKSAGQSE